MGRQPNHPEADKADEIVMVEIVGEVDQLYPRKCHEKYQRTDTIGRTEHDAH